MLESTQSPGSTPELLTTVIEQLEEDIVFGRLRPRERLVEEDLVARFGVKRHIVRQALIELERVGIVVRLRGKGARVCEFTPSEVEQLYAVRQLLETEAARSIPLPAPEALLAELRLIADAHGEAVEQGDLRTIYRANIRFHQVLFAACSNLYLAEAIDHFASKANAIRFYAGRDPGLFAKARDEHYGILKTLEKGDRKRLVDLCVRHLQPSRRTYIENYRSLFGDTP